MEGLSELTEVNSRSTLKGSPRNRELVRGGVRCIDNASEEVVREHLVYLGYIRGDGVGETSEGVVDGGEKGVVSCADCRLNCSECSVVERSEEIGEARKAVAIEGIDKARHI